MWDYLSKVKKPIVVYGMGNGADKIIDTLKDFGVTPYGVFASDDFVRGQSFRGYTVKKYSDFKNELKDFIVLVAFGTQRDEVLQNIRKINNEVELYAPDVPVYGGGLFTKQYAKDHANELETVYNMLCDEQSKKVFECAVNYRLSGKIDYLSDCETDSDEAFRNILCLTKNETFVDLGAYTGDTVADFVKRQGAYRKIFAVEPDAKNFKKLKKNAENLKNIVLINKSIGESDGESSFAMNGGRNSALSANGNTVLQIGVDSLLCGECASYIKFDIEGAEQRAIQGAAKTIKKYKPKMLVSAYHKTDDYFTLPLEILKIRDDYKVYIRHYKYIPAWDTQFYFV